MRWRLLTNNGNHKPDNNMKPHKKISKYLRGTAEVMKILANEIDENDCFDDESRDLMQKIGSNMLFRATAYKYFND